jgi:HSP20 family molecular chaperone IbpA
MVGKKKNPSDRFPPEDEGWFRMPFAQMFKELERVQEGLFKELEKEPEELRRLTANPENGGCSEGISVKIFSDGKHTPQIEVSHLGPRGWAPVQEKALVRLPAKKSIEFPTTSRSSPKTKPFVEAEQYAVCEAPYTYSANINKVTIELKISGVEKEENLTMQFYPESLEVSAVAPQKKKRYFAVLKMPTQIDRENTKIKVEKDKVVIDIPRKYKSGDGEDP